MLLMLPNRKELPSFPLQTSPELFIIWKDISMAAVLTGNQIWDKVSLGRTSPHTCWAAAPSSAAPLWSPAPSAPQLSCQKIAIKLWANCCISSHGCTGRWQWPLLQLLCSMLGWQRAAWQPPIPKAAGNPWMGNAIQQKILLFHLLSEFRGNDMERSKNGLRSDYYSCKKI